MQDNNTPHKQDDVLEPEVLDDATYERARQAEQLNQMRQSAQFGQSNAPFGQSGDTNQSGQQGQQNTFTYYVRTGNRGAHSGNGGNPNAFYRNYAFGAGQNAACLPSFVSVFLILIVFFQLGFLAMLGFIFFLLMGKAISFMVLFKNLINGKLVPPILLDCAVWIISYSLVAWLS